EIDILLAHAPAYFGEAIGEVHGIGSSRVAGCITKECVGTFGTPTSIQQNGPLTYSITSSARTSIVGGTSRSSALAVFMFSTVSYLVGACTGRSAGFSPLRMRST